MQLTVVDRNRKFNVFNEHCSYAMEQIFSPTYTHVNMNRVRLVKRVSDDFVFVEDFKK